MEIYILGTSHVSAVAEENIKNAIRTIQPTMIAVELDRQRADALLNPKQKKTSWTALVRLGFKGAVFALFAMTSQQIIGKIVKIQPGSDMLAGMTLAKKNNLPLALIDVPIQITLHRLSRALSYKDFFRFFYDGIYGAIRPKKFAKKYSLLPLSVHDPQQEGVRRAMNYLQQRYPAVHDVLVHQRNVAMVNNLLALEPGQKILVIVGAGHVQGMEELLKEHTAQFSYTIDGADAEIV